MKRYWIRLIFTFFAVFISISSFAQKVPEDSLSKSRRLKPGKVALLALIPGAGQVYNRKYWKVPVVYILAGACVYGVISYQKEFDNYTNALTERKAMDESNVGKTTPTPYTGDINPFYSQAGVESSANFYRKNRDLCGLGVMAVYLLSIVDAYVDAHLMEFDVNDKLALRVAPDMRYSYAYGATPQLSLTLKFK